TYDPHGRNLGNIEFIYGGVGRNVAHNLAQLSIPTRFVSTIDDTAFGQAIADELSEYNVDISKLYTVKEHGIGMWLAILGSNGSLEGSISQMPDLSYLEQWVHQHGDELIQSSSHVVLEVDLNANISQEIVKLSNKYDKPIY